MAKNKVIFICDECGHQESKWVGRCPSCGAWNTFTEESMQKEVSNVFKNFDLRVSSSQIMNILERSEEGEESLSDVRINSGFDEFDRVLGGGFVQDEVVLLAGDPGIGKSTLLLQTAHKLSSKLEVLYVSGEESYTQVKNRAGRLFGSSDNSLKLNFLGTGNLHEVLEARRKNSSEILIVDSIQTLYDPELNTLPGSLAQVKQVSMNLVQSAKQEGFVLIIVGHINKEGSVAGPKVLEHLVDCVLQFEGESQQEYRVVRSLKNRFGSTGEVGIFVMGENGLKDISQDDSFAADFTTESEIGVAKSMIVEGSRPVIVDIQALVSSTSFSYPKRIAEGIPLSRLQVLCAIIESKKLANLSDKDVYVRTTGNYSIRNYPYADLAIIAAIVSAAKKKEISQKNIYLGELSLYGKVTAAPSYKKYYEEVLRLFPSLEFVSSRKLLGNSAGTHIEKVEHISI